MNNKQKYRALCKVEPTIPIFSKDWWLDAECGEKNWDVALAKNGGKIVAALPYYQRRKFVFNTITMPPKAQSMGVWIKHPQNQNYFSKLAFEKKIFAELIDELPRFDYFNQRFHYSITNWLPFYWKGFQQTTMYTYVIEDLSNLEAVFANFDHSKRKNIKKAQKVLSVRFDLSAEDFYQNHQLTLDKQNARINYSLDSFKRIYAASYLHNSGRTIYAVDEEDNLHAALFVIWDDMSAYDLISTVDPDYRNSGAASLLVYEMIKHVAPFTSRFDFEGSMVEGVENSFRKFGAFQKPYFRITKVNSKLIKTALFLKTLS